MSTSKGQLFLGNLNYRATEEDIRRAFQVLGVATGEIRIPQDGEGRKRGYAFVDIAAEEPLELKEIVSIIRGVEIEGRPCRADVATPKPEFKSKARRQGHSNQRGGEHGGRPGGKSRHRDDRDEPSDW